MNEKLFKLEKNKQTRKHFTVLSKLSVQQGRMLQIDNFNQVLRFSPDGIKMLVELLQHTVCVYKDHAEHSVQLLSDASCQ